MGLVPVFDVDCAKTFYAEMADFHLDFGSPISEEVRVVQLTPPGSGCSIQVGKGITDIPPGSLGAFNWSSSTSWPRGAPSSQKWRPPRSRCTARMARARDAKASPSTTSGSSTSTTQMATAGPSSRPAPAASKKGYMTMPEKGTSGAKTFDVVVTRVLDAPVEEVWKAWKDPAYVMRWWGPTGFTSPSAEMDFRMGGSSLVCMRAPAEYGGQDMYNTWTYTRIEPHERIEFVSNFADEDGTHLDPATMGMPPGVPHDVPHVITLKAAGEDRTEMTVTEHGYTTEQARDLSRAGMEQCLDKMAATFAE